MLILFGRHLISFLLLNLIAGAFTLSGIVVFTEVTEGYFRFLLRNMFVFGVVIALVQAILFTLINKKYSLSTRQYFFVALCSELIVLNILISLNTLDSEFVSFELVRSLGNGHWKEGMFLWILHFTILLACVFISFKRKVPGRIANLRDE